MSGTKQTQSSITEELQAVAEQARDLTQQIDDLIERFEAAQGTQDIPRVPRRAPAVRRPLDQQLYDRVHKMISERPMLLREIVEATGVSGDNKIKVILTDMQRKGVRIVNLGQRNKALWYIPSSAALARLGGVGDDEDVD